MEMKQLSVFIENTKGRLADITEILGANGIDLRAITVADTSDFGILRIIVDKPDKAVEILRAEGMTVSLSKVLTVEVSHAPGGFAKVTRVLSDNAINIEYVYTFMSGAGDKAFIIVRTDDSKRAAEALTANGIRVLSHEEIIG